MTTALVVLATGAESWYAEAGEMGHKLGAEADGRTILNRAVDHAVAAGVGPVYVVIGELATVAPAASLRTAGLRVLRNPRQREGLATSLQVAMAAAQADGHDALVVGLGDRFLVEPAAWRSVARSPAPLAVAEYDGRRGHPVRLAAELWPSMPITGDEGTWQAMADHPDLVVEVPYPGRRLDVTTTTDLAHAVAYPDR